MKNKKGFTLIELLAVIVILGLLMAIAIPSVTKYITESRKKTVVSTIGNYITAMVNEVNDLTYTFTGTNTIYAVPIECISLERGGTNPFGAWHQASNSYWAYVLVQYDDETSSYTYGYTFKDSAGYGLYPTAQSKLNEQGKQIQTGLSLTRPTNGKVTTITEVDNWNGFAVDDTTDLVVLEATSEGEVGDGKTTCTLCQKGNNYAQVEQEKELNNLPKLSDLIKEHNTLITATPTLTTSSNNTSDTSGLYSSTNTNSGAATYYFRGNVTNNYVSFAGLTWKIIRINEDGTVRLILKDVIDNTKYSFSDGVGITYDYMYYSNSEKSKPIVDNWYAVNITDKGYDSYVSSEIFCEQAKVGVGTKTVNNATMTIYSSYAPNFKCSTDGNGKGIINSKVGLITYDEVIYAGGYYGKTNNDYYLYNNGYNFWTMSPQGTTAVFSGGLALYTAQSVWGIDSSGTVYSEYSHYSAGLHPVINLNANVLATGTGTSADPYVIQTK